MNFGGKMFFLKLNNCPIHYLGVHAAKGNAKNIYIYGYIVNSLYIFPNWSCGVN